MTFPCFTGFAVQVYLNDMELSRRNRMSFEISYLHLAADRIDAQTTCSKIFPFWWPVLYYVWIMAFVSTFSHVYMFIQIYFALILVRHVSFFVSFSFLFLGNNQPSYTKCLTVESEVICLILHCAFLCHFGHAAWPQSTPEEGNGKTVLSTLYLKNSGKDRCKSEWTWWHIIVNINKNKRGFSGSHFT